MRLAWIIGLSLTTALGACAAGSASDDSIAAPASEAHVPAGFGVWLAEQCPDGAVLGLVDVRSAETGELARTATCEQLRTRALADPSVRVALVDLYQGRIADEEPSSDGERVGASREPWSPFGIVCGIVAASLGAAFNPPGAQFGCKDPRADDPVACEVVTGGGSIALSVLCALL